MPAPQIRPLTPERWDDLVDLFGPERGANSGCWCMWWRLPRTEWRAASREERRERFRALVDAGPPPGILAYDGATAIGWCAIGPRATLPQMNRSRVAAPLDRVEGVWAVNCFYTRTGHRGQNLMRLLLDGAVAFARKHGAAAIEACPIETDRKLIWGEGYVGIASVFRAAGFEEVARRSPTRPLMRKRLRGRAAGSTAKSLPTPSPRARKPAGGRGEGGR
jgi:GNAT superfamily N-acetyltransferase